MSSHKSSQSPENDPAAGLPTSPEKLFAVFDELSLSYECFHHEAVYTVEESSALDRDIPGASCRNLYLRDKKKRNFLVTAMNETPVDLKALEKGIGCARLSFGSPERLWQYLGVRPGSVCPFAVINDTKGDVQLVLDKTMMEQELVNYHPLVNTMTVALSPGDLLKFLSFTGHDPEILDLGQIRPTS